MTRRMEKVNDLVQSELAELLQRRVKDPALADVFLSITRVEVAPDLTTARVFVSLLNADEDGDAVLAGLERSSPFLHRELVKRIRIKRVPQLRFILDRSIEEANRLTTIIRDVAREGRADE